MRGREHRGCSVDVSCPFFLLGWQTWHFTPSGSVSPAALGYPHPPPQRDPAPASRETRPQITAHRRPHLTNSSAVFNILGSPQFLYRGGGVAAAPTPVLPRQAPHRPLAPSSPPASAPARLRRAARRAQHLPPAHRVSHESLPAPAPSPSILHTALPD